MSSITVHMITKNEDRFVRYALLSIMPYVDTILITDTGSTDHTIEAISSLSSPKIHLTKTKLALATEITSVRQTQIEQTKTSWFWVVDGDEIYSDQTAKEVTSAINTNNYLGVTVRRYDLLGDLYHRQSEDVGSYQMWDIRGHLVLRALNLSRLNGLHLQGDYPLEGYYDNFNQPVINSPKSKHYITKNYLHHAMYLRRSSLGGNLPMINRSKNKIENGIPITTPIPEVFLRNQPLAWEGNPTQPRPLLFELGAKLLTPIKKLKRSFL